MNYKKMKTKDLEATFDILNGMLLMELDITPDERRDYTVELNLIQFELERRKAVKNAQDL